jgi:hypothetical protein
MISPSLQLSNGSGYSSTIPGYGRDTLGTPVGIAVDGSGNVWFADTYVISVSGSTTTQQSNLQELVGIATPVVTPLALGAQKNALGARP